MNCERFVIRVLKMMKNDIYRQSLVPSYDVYRLFTL